jgi:hypothetical protein
MLKATGAALLSNEQLRFGNPSINAQGGLETEAADKIVEKVLKSISLTDLRHGLMAFASRLRNYSSWCNTRQILSAIFAAPSAVGWMPSG